MKLKKFESFFENTLLTFLAYAILTQTIVYFFFFVFLSQTWSLMDDYGQALIANKPDFNFFTYLAELDGQFRAVGRFKPFSSFMNAARLTVLPIDPRAFHAYQLVLAYGVFILFYKLMRKLGLSTFRSAIGVFVALVAFSTKDILQYPTASEPVLLLFVFSSFYCFISNRPVWAALLFVMALITKESAVCFLSIYFAYAVFVQKKFDRKVLLSLAALLVLTFAMLAVVLSLPRIYTSNYNFDRLSVSTFLTALFAPPLRNYGPVFLVCAVLVFLSKHRTFNKAGIIVGATIVAAYTCFIVPWGPFNSWWYLHIPIPFGWALIIASVWPEQNTVAQKYSFVGLLLVITFGMLLTMNGATNYRGIQNGAKRVAEVICEESRRTPGVLAYSNCYEPSAQLMNYLRLEKKCRDVPEVKYVEAAQFDQKVRKEKHPYLFIYSAKCDYRVANFNTKYMTEFTYWTVYKNVP